ncbi:MAG: hypothetical protein A3F63_10525 [Pseudomonadales bacterium RIFCSPHIGHO2_12_FULL_40_16]|jgi:uncharacterized membrane protein YciS (DUF1049 family)|nr:MAG: hypothetical protein A3F63_10525 [Pseudomonadales bacterium RIFCSPHIGHO2_12_FULL_40_16]
MIMILIQTLPFALVFLLATAFIAGLVWCLCTAVNHAKYLKLEANHLQKIIEDQENEHAQIH